MQSRSLLITWPPGRTASSAEVVKRRNIKANARTAAWPLAMHLVSPPCSRIHAAAGAFTSAVHAALIPAAALSRSCLVCSAHTCKGQAGPVPEDREAIKSHSPQQA